jgi:hypothetical protein
MNYLKDSYLHGMRLALIVSHTVFLFMYGNLCR